MARILLVDDERDLVWALRNSLDGAGHEVFTAYDGAEALSVAQLHRPDLIVLDIVMPRLDGLQTCRRLRRDPTLAAVPILFLSERTAIEDRVEGLDGGGDDYLVKPFDLGELKARIRALLRRSQSAPNGKPGSHRRNSVLEAGLLTLDLHSRQVRAEEKTIQLTPTEFDLLRYLMVHPGQIFSGQDLLQMVWGYSPGTADSSLVRRYIKQLRDKIEPDPAHPVYVRTIHRHGYMLDRRQSSL